MNYLQVLPILTALLTLFVHIAHCVKVPCTNQVVRVTTDLEYMPCLTTEIDKNQEMILLSKYINVATVKILSFSGWYYLNGNGFSNQYNTIFSIMRPETTSYYYRNFAMQYAVSGSWRYFGI